MSNRWEISNIRTSSSSRKSVLLAIPKSVLSLFPHSGKIDPETFSFFLHLDDGNTFHGLVSFLKNYFRLAL